MRVRGGPSREPPAASGSWVATSAVAPERSASSAWRSSAALRVEPVEGLVEEEQVRVVEEGPAEREPLEHAAREGRDPLVPHAPEPEALEHRARPLAALGQAVEAPVEVEVLERRQLAVDERLVGEEADRATRRVDLELPVRRREPARRRAEAASSSRSRSAPSRARSRRAAPRGRAPRERACRRSAWTASVPESRVESRFQALAHPSSTARARPCGCRPFRRLRRRAILGTRRGLRPRLGRHRLRGQPRRLERDLGHGRRRWQSPPSQRRRGRPGSTQRETRAPPGRRKEIASPS